MQFDPAFGSRQPRLDQFRMMVSGVIQEDMDQPHARIQRLDRCQHHDGAHGVDRKDILHNSPAGLKIDGAVDIQAISPAALLDRDRHILRRPAADRARRMGWMYRIHEGRGLIGSHVVQQGLVGGDEGGLSRRVQPARDGLRLAVFHAKAMQQHDQARPGQVVDAECRSDPGADLTGRARQGLLAIQAFN